MLKYTNEEKITYGEQIIKLNQLLQKLEEYTVTVEIKAYVYVISVDNKMYAAHDTLEKIINTLEEFKLDKDIKHIDLNLLPVEIKKKMLDIASDYFNSVDY